MNTLEIGIEIEDIKGEWIFKTRTQEGKASSSLFYLNNRTRTSSSSLEEPKKMSEI